MLIARLVGIEIGVGEQRRRQLLQLPRIEQRNRAAQPADLGKREPPVPLPTVP